MQVGRRACGPKVMLASGQAGSWSVRHAGRQAGRREDRKTSMDEGTHQWNLEEVVMENSHADKHARRQSGNQAQRQAGMKASGRADRLTGMRTGRQAGGEAEAGEKGMRPGGPR